MFVVVCCSSLLAVVGYCRVSLIVVGCCSLLFRIA